MKKFFFILMSAIVLAGFTACENKDSDSKSSKSESGNPTYGQVEDKLPGNWQCTKSSKTSEDVGIVFHFEGNGNGTGNFTAVAGGSIYENTWQLEPIYKNDFRDNVKGAAVGLNGLGSRKWWFVSSISSTKMEWILIGGDDWTDKLQDYKLTFKRVENY